MCTAELTRFLFLVSILQPTVNHDSCPYYFYNALPYGIQANYNPFNAIINGDYCIHSPLNRIRLSVYPGIVRFGPFGQKFFLSGSKEWVIGINIGYLPIGAAWGR